MEYTLVANSGIQMLTFPLHLNLQDRERLWFYEWYDTGNSRWVLEPVYELRADSETLYYKKKPLSDGGYLADGEVPDKDELSAAGILPLRVDDVNRFSGVGDIYGMTFSDKNNKLAAYENVWLPLPYFHKRTSRRYDFGPKGWARMKLLPASSGNGDYTVLLAFDTRCAADSDEYKECPAFPDNFATEMDFSLCSDEFLLMDYCAYGKEWSYINDRLFRLAYPALSSPDQIKGAARHMAYIASYVFLVRYLAKEHLFPTVKLYKDCDVAVRDVDMVIDIGNSRTTALLIEDNTSFNQVRPLELVDYTSPVLSSGADSTISTIRSYCEPFDMRLAFRKVSFGDFGIKDSRQFVYPSLVRLGQEANHLIHCATSTADSDETMSTYSSPKRYLWDGTATREEWQFLVVPGERDDHVLSLPGITNYLKSNGTLDTSGKGGVSSHYSRRSLMTFAFLEMLAQARTQINSAKHRSPTTGFGKPSVPRRIKRIIVTCPTAMSKVEREALVGCARDAVVLIDKFYDSSSCPSVEVIPAFSSRRDGAGETWYYDEATCAQLVYMYGEVGQKYKGCCSEFFALYGKNDDGAAPSITVGSLDIGAGTSDLMISKYTYTTGQLTTITPDPLFYDSYYYAGDDMLYALIKNIMLLDEESAFRQCLSTKSTREYRQIMKNFFGKDYNGQTAADRAARKDFNIQYSIPLMYHYLALLSAGSPDVRLTYDDVFLSCPPNDSVIQQFKERTGIDVRTLTWTFHSEKVSAQVHKEFEPLLKKIATIMYSYSCDIVLLSGRPSSLPAIRALFLKYYAVSPNRLIVLNDYYVGDWYPFSENTGYIRNAKTIVAMGGVIAHYAAELSNLNNFVINLDNLKAHLQSTVNYVEGTHDKQSVEYVLTPAQHQGEMMISTLPMTLRVRQLDIDTYPSRALYGIGFNIAKLSAQQERKAEEAGNASPTAAQVQGMVNAVVDTLKRRLPYKVSLARDSDDKEALTITAVEDKNGEQIPEGHLEIHIQSLGIDDQYWLDTGAFDF